MKNQYRDQFLKLALETGIITVAGKGVSVDRTLKGNGWALRLAAYACRQAINQTPPLYDAEVLLSFRNITSNLPLVATVAQPFQGGDAKCFVHDDTHRCYSSSFLEGKKVVILVMHEDDVSLLAAETYVRNYGGQLLGTVVLFSERANEEKRFDIPVVRVLCHADITNHALASC